MIPRRLRRWESLVLLVVVAFTVLPLVEGDFNYGRPPHGVRDVPESPAAPIFYHGFFALLGIYCLWNLISPDENSDDSDDS